MNLSEQTLLLMKKIRRELEPIGYSVIMNRQTRRGLPTGNVILHIKWIKEMNDDNFICDCYAMIEFREGDLLAVKVLGDYPITHWILSRYFSISFGTKFGSRVGPFKVKRKFRNAPVAYAAAG